MQQNPAKALQLQCKTLQTPSLQVGAVKVAFRGHICPAQQRRDWQIKAADEREAGAKSQGKGLFGFVTDNPSSRGAIYSEDKGPESEIGAVTRRSASRGKDFGEWWGARATGSCPQVDEFTWFIREIGDKKSDDTRPPTLFLHGVPSQSYSFLEVLKRLDDRGWHAYAPDWIGFGYSEHTQPRRGFNYTEEEFHTALDNLLADKNVTLPLNLVAHGYITGQYAATWALKHPEAVAKLVLIGMPLNGEAKLPVRLQALRVPFAGAFVCQDCLIAERTLEGGSPYEMSLDDADIYRYPYLSSSQAGVSLLETVKKADVAALGARLSDGLSEAAGWKVPTLLLTGDSDKYVKVDVAEAVAAANPGAVQAKQIEASGHQPQEDYPQLVTQALVTFLG